MNETYGLIIEVVFENLVAYYNGQDCSSDIEDSKIFQENTNEMLEAAKMFIDNGMNVKILSVQGIQPFSIIGDVTERYFAFSPISEELL
jgi:hypothetical protein